ncbi:hypothetical protein ROJ8625_04131 [Roseivivax jejudonensis]|uniref:Uncharacterized protein n=1 Tax=Roseivivax jejudonensis TaxID=1529041 RepID=A0A1X7AB56_9RHOB|nr:hypothetical protein ROJ8625_04131 [Roseivivax jejudonensis]
MGKALERIWSIACLTMGVALAAMMLILLLNTLVVFGRMSEIILTAIGVY